MSMRAPSRTTLALAAFLGMLVPTDAPAAPVSGAAEAALRALERLGYGTTEAERAIRQTLAATGNGGGSGEGLADAEALVRRALHLLTQG